MNPIHKKKSIPKRFLDARWAWDLIQGPLYNRLIFEAASQFYQQFLHEFQPQENAQILDIGSGPGFVALQLAQENPNVSIIGVDYSTRQVQAANKLASSYQLRNCCFIQGDAMNLPFKDTSFDIVISVGSIKHWPDGEKGLEEIHRVLVPSGSVFIGEAAREAPDGEIYKFARRFTAWYVWDPFMRWYLRRVVFGQSYKRDEVESMARTAGFRYVLSKKVLEWPFFLITLRK